MYISLDIETTGLSYERDDIIEIGAVKFDGEKVKDSFQTFLQISSPLPPLITHITGITKDNLKDAPFLEDVYEDLLGFVGELPIIGHNIDFDLDFLATKGIVLSNPRFDTLQLSTIMLPKLPSHSLEIITEALNIKHKDKHRALDDATATADLFNILAKKIAEIDNKTLEKIKSVVSRSNWPLKDLIIATKPKSNTKKSPIKEENSEDKPLLSFDKKNILSFYEENGPLSKIEKNYEVRDPQVKMTEKIIDAMKDEYHLLCEAGTGTGKSIAYLLPAIFKARSEEKKVVISTHTKHLQDQLQNKDIPILQEALSINSNNNNKIFSSTVLKGRKNYLSKKRFELFMEKTFFQDHEVTMIIKILLWLRNTQTGDREELTLQRKEKFSWNDVCCDAIKCPHKDSEYLKKCFLAQARQNAQSADIVITNHALLISDTVTSSPVLPEYEYLILDEAHHLESEATQALTLNLTSDLLSHPLNNIKKINQKYSTQVDSLLSKIDVFFGILGIFYEKNIEYANSISNLSIQDHMKSEIEWIKLRESAENIYIKGGKFIENIKNSISEKESAIKTELETLKEYLHAVSFIILDKKLTSIGPYITWVYLKRDNLPGIKSAPLKIGNHLSGTLFNNIKSAILTSATLTTNNTFDYIRNQLFLGEEFNEIQLPSHFSYPDQVEVIIHKNIPVPNSADFFKSMSEIIKKRALENLGKMLVLFTSKRAIEGTYLELMPILKEKDITILAQGVSGSRNKILELFKKDPERSIIFGTNSFWEGIDIKGASLDCVVIQKLPFDPPDDPVWSARARLYDDPFYDYHIPRAILRFKQGFGRLIRSSSDTGKVIILDSRIIYKNYGHIFINSLPEGIKITTLD